MNSLIHDFIKETKVIMLIAQQNLAALADLNFKTQAPFTRIRIFLNPQLFLCGFKKGHRPYVAYPNRIRLSTRIRWYPDSLYRN